MVTSSLQIKGWKEVESGGLPQFQYAKKIIKAILKKSSGSGWEAVIDGQQEVIYQDIAV